MTNWAGLGALHVFTGGADQDVRPEAAGRLWFASARSMVWYCGVLVWCCGKKTSRGAKLTDWTHGQTHLFTWIFCFFLAL